MSIINPASINDIGSVALGSAADVDDAVLAAQAAFQEFQGSTKNERLGILRTFLPFTNHGMKNLWKRYSLEMGSPVTLSRRRRLTRLLSTLNLRLRRLRSSNCEKNTMAIALSTNLLAFVD